MSAQPEHRETAFEFASGWSAASETRFGLVSVGRMRSFAASAVCSVFDRLVDEMMREMWYNRRTELCSLYCTVGILNRDEVSIEVGSGGVRRMGLGREEFWTVAIPRR